jgi:hypothetical protein
MRQLQEVGDDRRNGSRVIDEKSKIWLRCREEEPVEMV